MSRLGLNNWTIMAPHAWISVTGESEWSDFFVRSMEAIPGIRFKDGRWLVPYSVVGEAVSLVCQAGLDLAGTGWVVPPPEETTWGAVETQLRASGDVPNWVLDGFLNSYQKEAIAFGWNRTGVHFWHPAGSGKTATDVLSALSVPGAVLVVTRTPSRIQFAREIERFINTKAYIIRAAGVPFPVRVRGESFHQFRARHKGQGISPTEMGQKWRDHQEQFGRDKPQTLKEYLAERKAAGQRAFAVVGWDILPAKFEELYRAGFSVLVLDELHRGKSSKRYDVVSLPELPDDPRTALDEAKKQEREFKSKGGFIKIDEDGARKGFLPLLNVASAAARLARGVRKRIGSTATPVSDRVRDLYGQLDAIEPNAWGNSTLWLTRYSDRKPGTYGGFDTRGASNLEELGTRLKKIAHIIDHAETHRHLPPKRRQSYYIAPEDQCAESGGFAAELRKAEKRGPTAVLEVKLAIAASRKRKAVLGLVEDHLGSNHKIVLFTGRRRDCDELGDLVRKQFKDVQVWSAHGEYSIETRQEIVDEYMAHPGPCVFVATGHAFGEALNLDTADAAMFVMLPYTPGQITQWEGRFHRASTKKPVILYYVISEGTVDEHIASILIEKLPQVQKIAEDDEAADIKNVLSGFEATTPDEFAASVLGKIDTGISFTFDEDDEV